MRLDIAAYGVLLAGGLGLAYWASMPAPADSDEDRISIFGIDAKSISEVSYKSKEVDAVATRRDDGRFWVTHTKTEAPPPPKVDPTKKDAPPPPAAAPKVTTEHFLANEKGDELLKSFNPFYASRIIGKVDDKQLDDFGLKDKTETFTLKGDGGKTFALQLGKRSYGSRNRFAREEGGEGRVLLVDDTAFENLERAPLRMYDRRLVSFDVADVQKAELRSGLKIKKVAHTQRDKGGELLWTDDEENAKPNPSLGSFMDKINKLRLTSYADAAEEAQLKDQKPFLEVTFEKDNKPLDHVSFYKVTGPAESKPTDKPGEKPADKTTYYVSSEFLKAHVKVGSGRVEPIEKDINQVLSDNKS